VSPIFRKTKLARTAWQEKIPFKEKMVLDYICRSL